MGTENDCTWRDTNNMKYRLNIFILIEVDIDQCASDVDMV